MITYLIGGDFILHIGDKYDLDAEVFSESMVSLGFIQHVKFETHNKGNGPFSCLITVVVKSSVALKSNVTPEMITCRRLKNLDIHEFCNQLQDFTQIVDLEELVSRFSENLKEALETLAPETTKRKSRSRE